MKEKNTLLPAINNFMPRVIKSIRYSKKIKVADIKQYLVDEYKLTKELTRENKSLKKEIDKIKIAEEKYDLTLITLSEYKDRISDKNKEIEELKNKISKVREELKFVKDEKNTLIIENKKTQKDNEKIINNFKKEFKKQLTEEIKNTKGTLSKNKLCEIIEVLLNG